MIHVYTHTVYSAHMPYVCIYIYIYEYGSTRSPYTYIDPIGVLQRRSKPTASSAISRSSFGSMSELSAPATERKVTPARSLREEGPDI